MPRTKTPSPAKESQPSARAHAVSLRSPSAARKAGRVSGIGFSSGFKGQRRLVCGA